MPVAPWDIRIGRRFGYFGPVGVLSSKLPVDRGRLVDAVQKVNIVPPVPEHPKDIQEAKGFCPQVEKGKVVNGRVDAKYPFAFQ